MELLENATFLVCVLVHSVCYNKHHGLGGFKLQKWKSEIRVPAWLGGDPPLDRLSVPPHGRREKRALSGFFYKTINLIHNGSALVT